MLTDKQFQHYRTFGFVVLRDFFTPTEVETCRAEYEEELDRVYEHAPFTGEKRYWTTMLHPRTPLYSSLLEDERFCSVAEQLYGDDVIGIGTDANRYVGDHALAPRPPRRSRGGLLRGEVRVLPGPRRRRLGRPAGDPRVAQPRLPRPDPRFPGVAGAGGGRRACPCVRLRPRRRGRLRHALLARQPRRRRRPPHVHLRLLQQSARGGGGGGYPQARRTGAEDPDPVRARRAADVPGGVAGQPRRQSEAAALAEPHGGARLLRAFRRGARHEALPRRHHRPGPHGQHHRRRGTQQGAVFDRRLLPRQRPPGGGDRRRPAARAAGGLPRALGRRGRVRGLPADGRRAASRPGGGVHHRLGTAETGQPSPGCRLPRRLARGAHGGAGGARRADAVHGEGDGELPAHGRCGARRLPRHRYAVQYRRAAPLRQPLRRRPAGDRRRRDRHAAGGGPLCEAATSCTGHVHSIDTLSFLLGDPPIEAIRGRVAAARRRRRAAAGGGRPHPQRPGCDLSAPLRRRRGGVVGASRQLGVRGVRQRGGDPLGEQRRRHHAAHGDRTRAPPGTWRRLRSRFPRRAARWWHAWRTWSTRTSQAGPPSARWTSAPGSSTPASPSPTAIAAAAPGWSFRWPRATCTSSTCRPGAVSAGPWRSARRSGSSRSRGR